jgi:hypothetical protein
MYIVKFEKLGSEEFRWSEIGDCCVFAGFRCEVAENCALLGYYAASSGNFLPTFRDNLSVPSSKVNNPFGFLKSQ